jgi:parallel beta helix pectate lyase-like protein/tectonin-like protein
MTTFPHLFPSPVLWRRSLLAVVLPLSCHGVATAQVPITYYVRNGGNDNASGTSDANAWATLAKVTAFDSSPGFQPGDSVLLQRGSVWMESAPLGLMSSGTANSSITLGDYGTETVPATISGRGQAASVTECIKFSGSYWLLRNIRCEEAKYGLRCTATGNGLSYGVDVEGASFRNIDDRTNDQDPSVGILFDGWGWQNVTVRGCVFDHVTNGVSVQGGNYTSNLFIDQCEAFGGWGAGFALQNVRDSRIANSRVHDVGGLSLNGTCGCILVSCMNVFVSDCSFSKVSHGGGPDGVGFDFESNNSSCTVKDCLFFDNEGAAILMFTGGHLLNSNIQISNCLFYNNNTVLHGSSDADSVVHLAIPNPNDQVSTGSITDCGLYKNSLSAGYLGGNWSGFTITQPVYGDQCEGWIPVYGEFVHVAVGNRGHICAVGTNNLPYEWAGRITGNSWNQLGGLTNVATISVGNDGEIWATGSGSSVWRYAGGGSWTAQPGSMQKVAVGSASNIWSLGVGNQVYHWNPTTQWNLVPLPPGVTMTDLDAGPASGDVWAIGGSIPWRYDNGWSSVNVSLGQISVHSDDGVNNIAAGVNGTTVRRTITGTRFHTLPGLLVEVSEGSDGTLWGVDASHHLWRAH